MEANDGRAGERIPDVLRKLNRENLNAIERGLLGEIPVILRPQRPTTLLLSSKNEVVEAKPPGILASCLPIAEVTPPSPGVTFAASTSPLKKTFSFRDKLANMSLLGKSKRDKSKKLLEVEGYVARTSSEPIDLTRLQSPENSKSKRFWFFRNKDSEKKDSSTPAVPAPKEQKWIRKQKGPPVYVRSKSFEFLPKALGEDEKPRGKLKSNRHSYIFGSTDSMGTAWTSNDSLNFIGGLEMGDDSPFDNKKSSASTVNTSTGSSSAKIESIFAMKSMVDLLDDFEKTVELFQDENYMSDTETYTGTFKPKLIIDKRKSSSFSSLPSPRIIQLCPPRVKEITDDFKRELESLISQKNSARSAVEVTRSGGNARRGSVTDWCVLEEPKPSRLMYLQSVAASSGVKSASDVFRRTAKKPMNRVRRVSSTKYWITPEESQLYGADRSPPYIIPRITSYRYPQRLRLATPPAAQPVPAPRHLDYSQENLPLSTPHVTPKEPRLRYEGSHGRGDYSPLSERSGADIEREFADSPSLWQNKRFGSNENLLSPESEMRDHHSQERRKKHHSMLAGRTGHSPVPAARMLLPHSEHAIAGPIFEGKVKRTKLSENGKKVRKNWTESHLVLTRSHLLFYKDEKAYYHSMQRGGGTPPSPTGGAASRSADVVIPLGGATVAKCPQQLTSRYAKSLLLTAGSDQYLVQDDSVAGAAYWHGAIYEAIHKWRPEMSALTQVVTPVVARNNNKKVGGSSNEDLTDPVDSIKVRKKLKKFLLRRPTKEHLIKKGFYKDEPVFGRSLEAVVPADGERRIPSFVERCVHKIESSEENMHTDGLYRASGNLSQVQKIRLQIDQNNLSIIDQSNDVHVLTGSLKLFFRELKEPLIPCKLFNRTLAATGIKSRDARIKEFRDIVNSLPACNYDTLKFLLEHLLKVTEHAAQNRMHVSNLAIVFGPTLLWAPAELAHNIAIDCIQQNHAIEILLTDFHEIFVKDRHKKSFND